MVHTNQNTKKKCTSESAVFKRRDWYEIRSMDLEANILIKGKMAYYIYNNLKVKSC